jgi:hypothetical protein
MSVFEEVQCTGSVRLLPSFAGNPLDGVKQQLNASLMRFDEVVGGVVVSYSKLQFVTSAAALSVDHSLISVAVKMVLNVLKPQPGAELSFFSPIFPHTRAGVVTSMTSHNIGLLMYGVFNISVASEDAGSFEFDEQAQNWQTESGKTINVGDALKVRFRRSPVAAIPHPPATPQFQTLRHRRLPPCLHKGPHPPPPHLSHRSSLKSTRKASYPRFSSPLPSQGAITRILIPPPPSSSPPRADQKKVAETTPSTKKRKAVDAPHTPTAQASSVCPLADCNLTPPLPTLEKAQGK